MEMVGEIQRKLLAIDFSKLIFHAIVEGPKFKHVVKKNNRPIWRRGRIPTIGKSADLIFAEQYLIASFRKFAAAQQIKEPYTNPVHAIYHFYFGPELNRQYAMVDLSNLFEIISDTLQAGRNNTGAGIIKNDKQIKSFDGTRMFKAKATKLEVFLLKFTEDLSCPTLPDHLPKA